MHHKTPYMVPGADFCSRIRPFRRDFAGNRPSAPQLPGHSRFGPNCSPDPGHLDQPPVLAGGAGRRPSSTAVSNPAPKYTSNTLIIAAMVGFFVLGVGHLYTGYILRGIILVAATIISYAVLFMMQDLSERFMIDAFSVIIGRTVIYIALYVYQLVDLWRLLKNRPDLGYPRE